MLTKVPRRPALRAAPHPTHNKAAALWAGPAPGRSPVACAYSAHALPSSALSFCRALSLASSLRSQVMVYPNRRNGSVSDSESQDESAQTETMIGWADVRELLKSFVTTHAQKLAFVSAVSAWDSALDAVAADFVQRKLVSVCGDDGQLLPQIDGDSMTLLDAVKQGFLSTGGDERTLTPRSGGTPGACPVVHRLALFKGGHISAILSQSDIMTYLLRHSSLMGPELCGATVDQLGFAGGRRVVCVTPSTPTHAAFTIMFSHGVSGVGVVGAQEELLGNLSASDLRRLQPHNLRVLALPIGEFLAALYGEPVAGYAPSADTYLQFARGPPGSAAVRKPVTVEPHTPFLSVLELLGSSSPRIHRVYVTEHGRPIGVITATDVLRMLAKREGGATEMVSPMDSQ